MELKILDYGSASIDLVFTVDHIVAPGETIASFRRDQFPGGKGLNQAIALAKAGAEVYFGGMIGQDGEMLQQALTDAGVHTEHLYVSDDIPSGNALIQVDQQGQNSIVLYAGANRTQTAAMIDQTLEPFRAGDMVLIQNEINLIDIIMEKAYEKGLTVVLNPSPFNAELENCDLSRVGIFLLNEVEGEQLAGKKDEAEILKALSERYPSARIVLTLGEKGALYHDTDEDLSQPAFPVNAIDSTAAGDTFTGFFLAALVQGMPTQQALLMAAKAASLSVCRKGASSSIPTWEEVTQALIRG